MAKMLPTVRANVKAWECDVMDHMNVQYYVARAAETVGQLQAALAINDTPDQALVHKAERVLYMREMRNGESYTVSTGILAMNNHSLTAFSEMHNLDQDTVAARFVIDLDLTNTATDALATFSGDTRRAAQMLFIQAPANLRPQQTPPQPPVKDLAAARQYGLFDTARGTVEPWECDARGNLHPRFFMSRCSDAVTHLQRHYGLTPAYREKHGLGSAALEYNIEYHHPIKAGEALITKSGLRSMQDKTQQFFHWFFNASTGDIIASVETTGVLFDFEKRKSVSIPDDLRAVAEPKFVKF